MPKPYTFTGEQIAELEAAKRKNKNKNIGRRLQALLLRAQGANRREAAEKSGFSIEHITKMTARYQNSGIAAITENHHLGNRRNLSFEEEEELLRPFMEEARAGRIVETSAILRAYEEKTGRTFEKDHGRIYRVLARHGWRKIMPRSRHPEKAEEEETAASKKKSKSG